MKKIIICGLFIAGSFHLFAQSTTTNQSMPNSSNTVIMPGNPVVMIGTNSTPALPVRANSIPADLLAKINSQYTNIYDITIVKGSNGQPAYVVRTIQNGVLKSEQMNSDGTIVKR
jgi:hypothetical protein